MWLAFYYFIISYRSYNILSSFSQKYLNITWNVMNQTYTISSIINIISCRDLKSFPMSWPLLKLWPQGRKRLNCSKYHPTSYNKCGFILTSLSWTSQGSRWVQSIKKVSNFCRNLKMLWYWLSLIMS